MDKGRTSQGTRATSKQRSSTAASSIRFGRPKPTRQFKPSEIHEMRMKTLQLQSQTKLQQTRLNRLKDLIAGKTEAINRTVNQKSEDRESPTLNDTQIAQLKRSVDAAENTYNSLLTDVEDAKKDDRTATFHELEEELKIIYLEYDRVQKEIGNSKGEAKSWEEKLRATDARASQEYVSDLEFKLGQARAQNASLWDKWNAWQVKIHKVGIEGKIVENREKKRRYDETSRETTEKADEVAKRGKAIEDELESEESVYIRRVEELMDVIDNQRRRIVEHLMGNEEDAA